MKTQMQKMAYDLLVKSLVQRQITCPRVPSQILDVRTVVVLVDNEGFPKSVVSPEGYAELLADDRRPLETLAERGITVDPATVPSVDVTL